MSDDAVESWSEKQRRRLDDFMAPRCVDVHCHCLPAFDNGPSSIEDAIHWCEAIVQDGVATVIATPHQLGRYDLELPHEIFVNALPIVDELREQDVPPILTHPERHAYLQNHANWIQECVRHGVTLQVTAGSILGEFRERANKQRWQLLRAGLVAIVASDVHDWMRRPPRMTKAIEVLSAKLGREAARMMAIERPLRVVSGGFITLR